MPVYPVDSQLASLTNTMAWIEWFNICHLRLSWTPMWPLSWGPGAELDLAFPTLHPWLSNLVALSLQLTITLTPFLYPADPPDSLQALKWALSLVGS